MQPTHHHSRKAALTVALATVMLSMSLGSAMAGNPLGRSLPALSQTYVSSAAKYGFNPQPEPPPGPALGARMFNPQPEPPSPESTMQVLTAGK